VIIIVVIIMVRVNRKMLPVLVMGIVATISIALALPIINLTVQQVGEGQTEVLSPFDNGRVNWVFDQNDPRIITGVNIIADKDLPQNTIVKVMLLDENENIIAKGQVQLNQDVTAGNTLPTITFDNPTEIKNVQSVVVVAVGPQV